jgi:hypothetical protein
MTRSSTSLTILASSLTWILSSSSVGNLKTTSLPPSIPLTLTLENAHLLHQTTVPASSPGRPGVKSTTVSQVPTKASCRRSNIEGDSSSVIE